MNAVPSSQPSHESAHVPAHIPAQEPPTRLATEFEDADDSPGLLLWRVTHRWQAGMRAALKPYGLTHVQFVLLASLSWLDADGPVTQAALAAHAATDVMMTSQVVRALAERELIRRDPHPGDRRAVALSVTPAGRELADRAVGAVEACDRAFFSALGEDAAVFGRALTRLAGAADPPEPSNPGDPE